jgi:hypothetical protein
MASTILALAARSPRCKADPSLGGTGSVGAAAFVNGITAVNSAMAESKVAKPGARPADGPVANPAAPAPGAYKFPTLSPRFEVLAEIDPLAVTTDVLHQISLFGELRYRLSDSIQVGGSVGIRYQGSDVASDVAAQALFGPTFNFGTDHGIRDAFFVSPKVGLTLERESLFGALVRSSTVPTLALSAGKRFSLGEHIAYTPSVGIVMQPGSPPCLVAAPIAISFFF